MCWPHVNRNVEPRIKALGKAADITNLANEVLDDIHTCQCVVTLNSYEKDFNALEDKYLKSPIYKEKESRALADVFAYFR